MDAEISEAIAEAARDEKVRERETFPLAVKQKRTRLLRHMSPALGSNLAFPKNFFWAVSRNRSFKERIRYHYLYCTYLKLNDSSTGIYLLIINHNFLDLLF